MSGILDPSALRKQAANEGVTSTNEYISWLEAELFRERKHRDELIATANVELERRRSAERALEAAGGAWAVERA